MLKNANKNISQVACDDCSGIRFVEKGGPRKRELGEARVTRDLAVLSGVFGRDSRRDVVGTHILSRRWNPHMSVNVTLQHLGSRGLGSLCSRLMTTREASEGDISRSHSRSRVPPYP